MTRVKLCGLTTETDLDAAVAAGADMVGFVSDVPIETPRELSTTRAAELVRRVPPSVTSVLVTMPETPEQGAELVERVSPDTVQVHDCSPETVATLADRVGADVFAGVDAADADLAAHASVADALVLDSTDERGAGGTGETHDWHRARELVDSLDTPALLAGGLTPENVAAAVETVRPHGVDVSSGIEHEQTERNDGVERTDGMKDRDAMKRFVERANTIGMRA